MTVQYSVGKTNCLTEVPNNVKLRLDNGILTLEKGSKVYIPNGYDINTNIIGSPTIVNGVVSGFSTSNYLKTPYVLPSKPDRFEYVVKFTTGDNFIGNCSLISSDADYHGLGDINIREDTKKLSFWISSNGSSYDIANAVLGKNVLEYNTLYYMRYKFDGSQYTIDLSTNKQDWVNEITVVSSVKPYGTKHVWIGLDQTTPADAFTGSIDLKESYIKINDEMFWQGGDGNGKPVFKEHTIQNDITADTSTYTGFYCYGFGNYGDWLTVLTSGVSSATIPTTSGLMGWYDMTANRIKRWHTEQGWQEADFSLPLCYCTSSNGQLGIVQEFKAFSYIGGQTFALPGIKGLIPNGWNEDGTYKTVEFEIDEVIRGNAEFNNNVANYGVINLENNGNLTLCRSAKSATSYNEETNLIYRSDGLFPNSTIVFETQSSSNIISSFVPTQVKTTNDLKNMQIKYGVGNTNCLTSVPHNINWELDPLNVTIVGTPTFNNGNITGFSNANYLKIAKTFSPSSQSWEVFFQFSTGGTFDNNKVIFDASSNTSVRAITMYINKSMKMCVGLSSNATSWDIKAESDVNSFTFVANKVYAYKLTFDGVNTYKGEVYDFETGAWTTDFTTTSTAKVYSSNLLIIGNWQGLGAVNAYPGIIDISRSYIKINGSTWWKGGTGSLILKAGSKVYVPNGFEVDVTTLYAWTSSSGRTFYIDTPTPTIDSKFYTENGTYYATARITEVGDGNITVYF